MPAEFNVHAAGVSDLAKCGHDWWEVDFTFAESQVVMNAAPHVLNVDIAKSIAPAPQVIRDGALFNALHMTNVDRQAETRRANFLRELSILIKCFNPHAGFRLKAKLDSESIGVVSDSAATVEQPLPDCFVEVRWLKAFGRVWLG